MGYAIDYNKMDLTEEQKQAQRLADFESWMGEERVKLLKEVANEPFRTYAQWSFLCGFAGVQGSPVVAAWDAYRTVPDWHVQDYVERMTQA